MPDNCEFNNQDIKDACSDMQSMDDTQKLQRMHELITALDSKYADISSTLTDESNQMAGELHTLFGNTFKSLLELSDIRSTPDLFWQAYTLKYMIYDFINDGKVDDDLFLKYEQFGDIRKAYIDQIRNDQPKINIFPNPAHDNVSCNISFSYRYAEILFSSGSGAVGSAYDLQQIISADSIEAFDPYVGLPLPSLSAKQPWTLGIADIPISIVDSAGKSFLTSTLPIDLNSTISGEYNVSAFPNGTYFMTIHMPQFTDISASPVKYELEAAGVNTSGTYTVPFTVMH